MLIYCVCYIFNIISTVFIVLFNFLVYNIINLLLKDEISCVTTCNPDTHLSDLGSMMKYLLSSHPCQKPLYLVGIPKRYKGRCLPDNLRNPSIERFIVPVAAVYKQIKHVFKA